MIRTTPRLEPAGSSPIGEDFTLPAKMSGYDPGRIATGRDLAAFCAAHRARAWLDQETARVVFVGPEKAFFELEASLPLTIKVEYWGEEITDAEEALIRLGGER